MDKKTLTTLAITAGILIALMYIFYRDLIPKKWGGTRGAEGGGLVPGTDGSMSATPIVPTTYTYIKSGGGLGRDPRDIYQYKTEPGIFDPEASGPIHTIEPKHILGYEQREIPVSGAGPFDISEMGVEEDILLGPAATGNEDHPYLETPIDTIDTQLPGGQEIIGHPGEQQLDQNGMQMQGYTDLHQAQILEQEDPFYGPSGENYNY